MPLALIKWMDQLLGAPLCLLLWLVERLQRLARPSSRVPCPVRKVLFIKLWGVGSLLNAVPAFAAVKWGRWTPQLVEGHPPEPVRASDVLPHRSPTEVYLLTFRRNAGICELLNVIDGVLFLENPRGLAFAADVLRLWQRLRAERFDVVIDLEFFVRFTTILSYLSKAPRRVGFDSPKLWRSSLYTHVAPFRAHAHITDCFLDLARCLGAQSIFTDIPALKPPNHPTTQPPHRPTTQPPNHLTTQLPNYPTNKPLVCLNPNASEVSPLSRWMPENFARLADELIERYGVTVGLTGAPHEAAFVESVRHRARHADEIINFAGQTTIPQFIALLRQCRVFITNDSGPMHLAAAIGVPTIALFGPDTPTRYGPRGAQHTILYKPPWCSPCYNLYENKSARCKHEVYQYCLKSITVEEVVAAAEKYLKTG